MSWTWSVALQQRSGLSKRREYFFHYCSYEYECYSNLTLIVNFIKRHPTESFYCHFKATVPLKVHSEYPPLFLYLFTAVGGHMHTLLRALSCPAQLRNYFHYALPAELSPKLHVSCCGKYMTFGDATSWENNERLCT